MKFSCSQNRPKLKLIKLNDCSETQKAFRKATGDVKTVKESFQNFADYDPLSFLAGKQIQSIDYQLYSKLIQKDNNVQDLQITTSNYAKEGQKSSPSHLLTHPTKKYSSFKKQKPKYQISFTNKQRKYAGRLTAKQYYKNIQFMDRSSPLEMWKELSRSYTRTNSKENETGVGKCGNGRQEGQENQKKRKMNDRHIEMLINGEKDELPEQLHKKTAKMIQLQELIGKWKQGQQRKRKLNDKKAQTELQDNIVLRKSLSCKISLHQFHQTQLNQNIQTLITQQNTTELPNLKKKDSKRSLKKGSLPTQPTEQSPIMLIHKQPLEQCMEVFFKPAKEMTNIKGKPNPLELMKIKSKKLSTRNIECLERLKMSLFREKTNRDLFNNFSLINDSQVNVHKEQELRIVDLEQRNSHQSVKSVTKRNSDLSLCQLLKKDTRRSTEVEKEHSQRSSGKEFKPTNCCQAQNRNKDHTKDGIQTPSQQKQSLSSSAISFSQEPTPQAPRTNVKGLSLINAW